MDVVNAANVWAKGEITSAIFFMCFGVAYILVSLGFWKFSGCAIAKASIVPLLIAGGLLFSAGISFYISNKSKLKNFETEYQSDSSAVISAEIERTEATMKTYQNVALKVFPAIILVAVLVFLFVGNIKIKAICIGIIAFLSVLVLLDSQALKRMKTYHHELNMAEANQGK